MVLWNISNYQQFWSVSHQAIHAPSHHRTLPRLRGYSGTCSMTMRSPQVKLDMKWRPKCCWFVNIASIAQCSQRIWRLKSWPRKMKIKIHPAVKSQKRKMLAVLVLVGILDSKGCRQKKKQYIYRHCPNWWWPPSLLPYFWQIYFWQSVDHVDLPPSPRIFDKNHEILGFETCILYYPHYFLRVRGTDRMTQSPFWARLSNKSYKIEWFYFWQYVLWPPPSPTFVKNSFLFNFLTWGWPPPSYLDNVCKYTVFFLDGTP